MKILTIFSVICSLVAANVGRAHEFWIEADSYQVAPGNTITARFRNGEEFSGPNLAFFDFRSARLESAGPDGLSTLRPRSGDNPAIVIEDAAGGLTILMHETKPGALSYKTWEKFQKFADHKDFQDIEARHQERGLPRQDFSESYTRFAKALVAVGPGTGHDSEFGFQTEFVALTNPYHPDFAGEMQVQLLYLASPRPDAQVEVFDRAPDGSVTVTLTRTDADGMARVPVTPGHTYLFDAVVLRPAAEDDKAVWETLWAALTFAVPAKSQ